jgi:hypothetical protein
MSFSGNGVYKIGSYFAIGLVIDCDSDTIGKEKTKVHVYHSNDKGFQLWNIEAHGNECYKIGLLNHSKFLGIEDKDKDDDIFASESKKSEIQLWKFIQRAPNIYSIENVQSHQSIYCDSRKAETALEQKTYENAVNFHWSFDKIN